MKRTIAATNGRVKYFYTVYMYPQCMHTCVCAIYKTTACEKAYSFSAINVCEGWIFSPPPPPPSRFNFNIFPAFYDRTAVKSFVLGKLYFFFCPFLPKIYMNIMIINSFFISPIPRQRKNIKNLLTRSPNPAPRMNNRFITSLSRRITLDFSQLSKFFARDWSKKGWGQSRARRDANCMLPTGAPSLQGNEGYEG